LCIGEYGRVKDLKTEKVITNLVISLFKAPDQEVREAASIALGNIAAGNPTHFLKEVFAMVK